MTLEDSSLDHWINLDLDLCIRHLQSINSWLPSGFFASRESRE